MYFNVPEVICSISRDDVVNVVKGVVGCWWTKAWRMKMEIEGCDKAGREGLVQVLKGVGFECE
jgi:hypothetical protein